MSYYANGLFKAKSTSILKENQLETLIAKTDEQFFELLKNYGFGFNDSIEHLYEKEVKKLKKELTDALGGLKELKVFFYPYDILNTKLIYKQVKNDIDTKDFYLKAGNIDPHLIYQALKYDNYEDLKEYETLFKEIKKIDEVDYQKINYKIDALFIEKMKEVARSDRSVRDYLNVKLNLTSVLSLIRAKALNLPKEELQQIIHATNSLPQKTIINLYDKSINELKKFSINLGYYSVSRSLEQYSRDKDLENLESNFESNLAEILIDYSFQSEGLGFIMSYVYRKLMELKNIKIIYYDRTTSLDKLFIPGR